MLIGIDARLWSQSGVGRYIRNLVGNLQIIDSKNEYIIFLLDEDFSQVKLKSNFKKIKVNFKWYGLAEQIKFPSLLKKYNLDLMHFPHFNVPIFYEQSSRFFGNGKGKFIVTIHDLIHQNFVMKRSTTLNPLTYKVKQLGYKTIFNKAVKNSSQILVPSNYVKDLLVDKWNVNQKRISVTYEGVDDKILSIVQKMSQQKISQIQEKFKIKPPYIFYVGNAHPHKNVEGLIKAFLEIRKNYQYLQLVLSGHDHYFWQRIKKEFQHKDIIYTGFITDDELVALYKAAQTFAMPSFEEGFGIPLLEAMACNCPVVSSNAASLPEIGDNAALYFDPKSSDAMTEKIMEVLNNQKLRQQLVEKGQKRFRQFSLKKMAEETLKIYESV